MDKEIPKKEQLRRRFIMIAKVGAAVTAVVIAIVIYTNMVRPTIDVSKIKMGTADVGTIESTITSSGIIKPALEERILSPISSRVVEVYKTVGDSVDVGEPLLLLNLNKLNEELRTLYEQLDFKREELRQARIQNENDLHNREMDIESKKLTVEQLRQDLRNEQYLDSLGSGTGENIRRAQASLRSAEVELERMKRELENQRDFQAANLRMKQTELERFERSIGEQEQVHQDARILSPRKAILTRITNKVGENVNVNDEVAVVADLSTFIIEGELPDAYNGQVAAGSEVIIRLGKQSCGGKIAELSPLSEGSMLPFVVAPETGDSVKLKPGARAEIHVKSGTITDAVRIPNEMYYTSGPGTYELYVVNTEGTEAEKRLVTLGKANYDYVEVIKGLDPGEKIILSDVSRFKSVRSIKLTGK
ncbi:MAG: HlyD family efflux transporter periplasmic adaptor subunit [Muribaculaceae bacterium]|nr:HlyD family efflux transporter periplasmic adaptor subunit [Muribaculaceae bacterium]